MMDYAANSQAIASPNTHNIDMRERVRALSVINGHAAVEFVMP